MGWDGLGEVCMVREEGRGGGGGCVCGGRVRREVRWKDDDKVYSDSPLDVHASSIVHGYVCLCLLCVTVCMMSVSMMCECVYDVCACI